MTTQDKNVPDIRFPEFTEEWKKEKIEPYLKLYVERVKADTDIPILTSSRNGLFMQKDYFDNRELDNEGEYGVVPRNYFTYRHMSDDSTFKFNINNICDKGAVSKEYPVFTTKGIDSFFLQLKLNYGDEFKQFAHIQKAGGTRTRLYFSKLINLNLSIPILPEQQKIAAFLTAVDEKIQQLAKKKNLLEQYKKGVMQKIFNQEIRFKDDDGNDFADWELKELKDIAVRVTAKNKSNEINKVLTNSATKGVVNQQDYFDKDIANQNNLQGYYIVEKDDFVYNPRISTFAPVGPIKRNNLDTGLMSPLYSVFRFKKVNLNFIEHFFETRLWHDYLKSIANYGARHDRMNITVENFFDMPILLPLENEQKKIANFLSAIDDKINLVNRQLEKTRNFKKGLLQQMFV